MVTRIRQWGRSADIEPELFLHGDGGVGSRPGRLAQHIGGTRSTFIVPFREPDFFDVHVEISMSECRPSRVRRLSWPSKNTDAEDEDRLARTIFATVRRNRDVSIEESVGYGCTGNAPSQTNWEAYEKGTATGIRVVLEMDRGSSFGGVPHRKRHGMYENLGC